MSDLQTFRNQDLVLEINQSVDPKKFDISKYEAFLDALCGNREYQKEAIRRALLYMLGDRYADTQALADENFYSNPVLRERYGSIDSFIKHLEFPDRLSFTEDLATGTGKSYVMYGIARIMLAEGVIDRVLVLCPSLTIEEGLLEKFRALSAEGVLADSLPQGVAYANPAIIDGSESIVPGSICIENFHAVLEHVGSSIRDSLRGQGQNTLILNDEAHHVYNKPINRDSKSQDLKKWKSFLVDPEFDFRFIGGFSGTCYVDNDYFADVIYRYSLREAMDERFIKTIDYVAEDASPTQDEKFQKVLGNHERNHSNYRQIKPITIFVTRDIGTCQDLADDLVLFLAEHEGISKEEANRKVLPVTSAQVHRANVRELKEVDRKDNPIEWVVSVSMLTEGWDVKNVFQIVPHEERAFNSKLLIAQVLGRGLRLPEQYPGARVIIFNHDAWSSRIQDLVLEIIEREKRLTSSPTVKPIDYNFDLHQIDYRRVQKSEDLEEEGASEIEKGYVSLVSQAAEVQSQTTYLSAVTGDSYARTTNIKHKMYSVDEMVEKVHNKLKAIDLETAGKTSYSEEYDTDRLRQIINSSLDKIDVKDRVVSEDNHQRILQAFGAINKTSNKTVRYHTEANTLMTINTNQRPSDRVGFASLRHGIKVFYDEYTRVSSDDETKTYLDEIQNDMYLEGALKEVANSFNFKTSLNLVIANRNPEFRFIRQLVRPDNAQALDAWMKSSDKGFYAIEYTLQKGTALKRSTFNPDFFIKKDDTILVIEIKDDSQINDPALENKAKYIFAQKHFAEINQQQDDLVYCFQFLTPNDFDLFFQHLRDNKHKHFRSRIDVALAQSSGVESINE